MIYVGNLAKEVREEDLRKEFGKYGTVKSVSMPKAPRNGDTHYGFVEMLKTSEANEAIRRLDGALFNGAALVVREAELRKASAGFFKRLTQFVAAKRRNVEFSLWDKTERDLIRQHFGTLRATYLVTTQAAKANTPSDEVETTLEELLDSERVSRKNNNLIEQLLIERFDENRLDVELQHRLVEAEKTLTPETYAYFKTAAAESPLSIDKKRALVSRMVADLQWRYQIRTLQRKYGRTIRAKTGVMFVLAVLVFLIPRGFVPFVDEESHWIYTAVKCGWLGAAFSMLMSLNYRLREITRNLDALKVQRRWGFIVSRVIIGIGASMIFLYFIQAGIINGPLFPQLAVPLDSKNFALLVVWSFLAGFSEKLVPNLLTKTEQQAAMKRGAQDVSNQTQRTVKNATQ